MATVELFAGAIGRGSETAKDIYVLVGLGKKDIGGPPMPVIEKLIVQTMFLEGTNKDGEFRSTWGILSSLNLSDLAKLQSFTTLRLDAGTYFGQSIVSTAVGTGDIGTAKGQYGDYDGSINWQDLGLQIAPNKFLYFVCQDFSSSSITVHVKATAITKD